MKRKYIFIVLALVLVVLSVSVGIVSAAMRENPPPADSAGVVPAIKGSDGGVPELRTVEERREFIRDAQEKRVTSEERQEAADRRSEIMEAEALAAVQVGPLDQPDFFGSANWAFSPALDKFVDTLPLLNVANNLGNSIPVAVPDTTTYPGSDYYELSVIQFSQKMHTGLAPTTLRGYVQTNRGTDANGQNTIAPPAAQYLGPLILTQEGRPVRIKFTNALPTNQAGQLFVPVDRSVMGAGYGPLGADTGTPNKNYSDNRAVIHLHGGHTPWISDGTPHQWITPAGENTAYPKGVSVQNVPDMPEPGEGSQTYYFTNEQSSRLLFYHDHSWGITRLNVYVGEAAGYLIRDDTENDLIARNVIPSGQYEIPLMIQDKTFVDAAVIRDTDPTWRWGTGPIEQPNPKDPLDPVHAPKDGDLWYPHVYLSAQNPYDLSGVNPFGRWHYGPWFWPPTTGTVQPQPNAYYDPANPTVQPPEIPGVPWVSAPGESFFDTPVVNGVAYPTLTVEPTAYRFRVLNAANDRFWNLQLYEASSIVSGVVVDSGGTGYSAGAKVTLSGGGGSGATAEAVVDQAGTITAIDMLTVGSGYTSAPTVTIEGAGTGALAHAVIYDAAPTEVGMVPAVSTTGYPAGWPIDGRVAGVPDPTTAGPQWIQIGTEGGFLPQPAVIPNQPITWNNNPTTFNFGNVDKHSLLLGPAERADVIVDFSQYAGKTLILYNDAPAAFPALDPRYDYYTASPDLTAEGGYQGTLPGQGPNTRTIMQIVVSGTTNGTEYNKAALDAEFISDAAGPGVFQKSQNPIIVGQSAYNSTYNMTFPAVYPEWGVARIQDFTMKFRTVTNETLTLDLEPKAIQDEMGEAFDEYGRMSGKLGLQLRNAGANQQTFVLQNFVDPVTEIIDDSITPMSPILGDGTQIWKITHNGVDTHPIHFHLFDVQLINRVGWDGAIRLPDANELGWKDTVRISPLEDTIVALRATASKQPWGQPNSERPLNPAQPLGSQMGFSNFDPLTGNQLPTPTVNKIVNMGWEYVWHCHILSHEEMDMMRPISFKVTTQLAAAPQLSATGEPGAPVVLTWTDGTPVASASTLGNPANEIGFRVERAPDVNGVAGTYTLLGKALANAITYTDTTTQAGSAYFYRVVAYNASGDSTSNAIQVGTAAVTIPLAPSNLRTTAVAYNSVALAWNDNSNNEDGFYVERGIFSGTWVYTRIATVNGAATYTDTTVLPRTSYRYRVQAYNVAGTSAYSNVVSVSTPAAPPTPPAAPTNLTATATKRLGNIRGIILNWTDNSSNETGFQVYRSTNQVTWTLVNTTRPNIRTYTNWNLPANTRYYYQVRATNASGQSAYTNIASALTGP